MLPRLQAQRTTIIIRDLPADTTEEELFALFADNGLSKPHSIHSVLSNWFVTMADEGDTTSTFMKLRSLKFKGESVKARVKSEHVLRGGGAASGAAGPSGDGEHCFSFFVVFAVVVQHPC